MKSPSKQNRRTQDGGGPCSPGRWPPARRVLPPKGAQIQATLDTWLLKHFGNEGVDKLAYSYFAGKFYADPLAVHIEELRVAVMALLTASGLTRPENEVRRNPDQIDFAFIMLLVQFSSSATRTGSL
ncbi:unnamed protein product [Polarella glacialis]|uniref:Uncharacterized protein n=1 Tax=Polarella glacialis TaxID=89957 RepID=A0A813H7R2_POLGL|nr:unnamed protein product [Polarella glacialis]